MMTETLLSVYACSALSAHCVNISHAALLRLQYAEMLREDHILRPGVRLPSLQYQYKKIRTLQCI
jgi:hypothetical protein